MKPRYLRISTTPACGFRCPYCQPQGPAPLAAHPSLSTDQIARAVAALSRVGVGRVRLTGGEPLLRADCEGTIASLLACPDIHEVSITTNGERLQERATALWAAGLRRLNIHLDTLRGRRFKQLAGRDAFDRVMHGIDVAREVGFSPIKVNVVLMKGINDDEILDFCAWGILQGVTVRFIELMNTGPARRFVRDHFMAGRAARDVIASRYRLEPRFDDRGCSPVREYILDGGLGVVGFIEAESKPFCSGCNRLRLTHDGKLSLCLFGGDQFDLAAELESNTVDELELQLLRFFDRKEALNPAVAGGEPSNFSMAHIGG